MSATEDSVIAFLNSPEMATQDSVTAFLRELDAAEAPAPRRPLRQRVADLLRGAASSQMRVAPSDRERMLLQGASFGFGDEIAGLGAALVPGGRGYTEARDASRDRVARVRREQPRAALVSEMVGGALVPGAGGLKLGGAILRGTGSRVLAALGGGAGAGALAGAVQGAGDAPEMADVPGRVGTGAVVGAGAGGVLGAAGSVAARGVGRVVSAATRRPSARARDIAVRTLDNELRDVGTTLAAAPGLARAQPGGVVADLGENLARRSRAAVNTAPRLAAPGGPVRAIRERTNSVREAVADEITGVTGLQGTYAQTQRAARENVPRVGRAVYGPLEEAFPRVEGPNIAAALQDERVALAARRARLGDQPPSFRQAQEIYQRLRDRSRALRQKGYAFESQQAMEAADLMETAMREDVPGFREANDAYRVAIAQRDALKVGRQFANRPADEIAARMAELPPEAHDNFRRGLAEGLSGPLREQGGVAGAPRFVNAGSGMRERLGLIAGDPDRAAGLARAMDERFGPQMETGAAVTGNSTTAQQLSDADAALVQTATDPKSAIWSLFFGPSRADDVASNELIGRFLLSRPDVAEALANPSLRNVPGMEDGGMFGAVGALQYAPALGGLFGGLMGHQASRAAGR